MIILEDNDSSVEVIHSSLQTPEKKYPRDECAILYKLILDTSPLEKLIESSVEHHLDKQDIPVDIDYELIIENQRGLTLFGFPLFAPKFFPWDPPQYVTPKNVQVHGLVLYPLPTEQWHWIWDKWHVTMIGDVDDQGWKYAWNFNSKAWRGRTFLGCVRRRVWMRLRERPSL